MRRLAILVVVGAGLLAACAAPTVIAQTMASQALNGGVDLLGPVKLTLLSTTNPNGAGGGLSGKIPCVNGGPMVMYLDSWVNASGHAVTVHSVQLWIGAAGGGRYDVGGMMLRRGDRSVLFFNNWDRYAEPNALHDRVYQFSPYGLRLEPGDGLDYFYWCTSFNGPGYMAGVSAIVRLSAP